MGCIFSLSGYPEPDPDYLMTLSLNQLLQAICASDAVKEFCINDRVLRERYIVAAKHKYYTERFLYTTDYEQEKYYIIMKEFVKVFEEDYERCTAPDAAKE